jgi:spermidine/putrescine transport system substrate-binding protein
MIFRLFWILTLLLCLSACGQRTQGPKVLNVYNWNFYIGKNTIKNFEKEFNIKVRYDLYSTNEEMLGKIQTGMQSYDVVFPSDYTVGAMIKDGLLEELRFENIPNFKNVDERFTGLAYDPQNKYSIAYQFGTQGIAVNTEKVTEPVESWDILWDPKYKEKMVILDDMRAAFVIALKKLGYSINTKDPKKLEEARNLLIQQKPLLKAYTAETPKDLLKSGDIWIAGGYSGDIYQVIREAPHIRYILPKEGTNLFVDAMCIPKNAPHRDEAELFINYLLRPDVSAEISNDIWYRGTNKAAKPFIRTEVLNDPGINPSGEFLKKCEPLENLGEELTRIYDRLWNDIKNKE